MDDEEVEIEHGLSLSMDDDNDDDNNNNNNDETVYESEDEERIRAKVNSPKANAGDDDYNAKPPIGLNLRGDEEENITPNTAFRDDKNINSPRESKQFPTGLMTQVARPDNYAAQNPGGLMTQVPRDDTTQMAISSELQPTGGLCACVSCLWCCCSSSPPEVHTPIELHESSSQVSIDPAYVAPAGGSMKTSTNQPKGNRQENANASLVTSYEANSQPEESYSSTIYPLPSLTLLPPLDKENYGKKCLVLDLDETLVHSSFKPIADPHFVIPVEIDRIVHHVYVLKRPFVDDFLLQASKNYEIVIFTASLSKYADPLLDKLDIHRVIAHRLFRESCVIHGTAYVKDLRKLGRKLKDSIIVDNSPPSYLFQPANAIPIASWFDDMSDRQLPELLPVLDTTLKNCRDVRYVLDANNKTYRWLCQQSNKPLSLFTTKNQNP